jgi:hypothetical protein
MTMGGDPEAGRCPMSHKILLKISGALAVSCMLATIAASPVAAASPNKSGRTVPVAHRLHHLYAYVGSGIAHPRSCLAHLSTVSCIMSHRMRLGHRGIRSSRASAFWANRVTCRQAPVRTSTETFSDRGAGLEVVDRHWHRTDRPAHLFASAVAMKAGRRLNASFP